MRNPMIRNQRYVVLESRELKNKSSALKLDEKLIQGDLPIIEYRKKREELKARAQGQQTAA